MRLANASLDTLSVEVARPTYDRSKVRCGVVHLGIGAFHRAHQALVFERALQAGDLRWGIVAASLRSPDTRDDLGPQDFLYTIVDREGHETHCQVIGAVQSVLVAPENPAALVEAIAASDVHIVTLTITEKGYRLDPATGRLRADDADVAADRDNLEQPRTALGFLVAGLALRRARGMTPITIVSCDNLPHNGERLRAATLEMAGAHDPSLASWIADYIAFPATMVDRIVPATTAADIEALEACEGYEDRAMVKTEPFLQWVIEDWFSGLRPDLIAHGATLVQDVAPWEEAKLRLLNGGHSGIAYLGGLAGIRTVDAFVAEPAGWAFVERLWDEAQATLSLPPTFDAVAYRRALMGRFTNSALAHKTRQIAMDGSQKLPQRLLAPIAAQLENGRSIEALALAVAAWMRWQSGYNDHGETFVVDDPLADMTSAAFIKGRSRPDAVASLLSIRAIFPRELAEDDRFVATVQRWFEILSREGARLAIRRLVSL